MKYSSNKSDAKVRELAKILRKNSSLGEIMLWKELRGKQLLGYEFQRQKPLGKYIVDFYCAALRLAIEIDGVSAGSDEQYRFDLERDATIGTTEVHILRFQDETVRNDMKSVLLEIRMWINEHHKNV
jgi:very-short-patch-repair endonuclease